MLKKTNLFRRPNLRTILYLEKKRIESIYGNQQSLNALLPNSENCWIIQNVVTGYSILLYDENIESSQENLTQIQDKNCLILIDEILAQLDSGEQNLQELEKIVTDIKTSIERLQCRFSENLEKLMLKKVDGSIVYTLIQNHIKEIDKFYDNLNKALKENNATIDKKQKVINKYCELLFASSMKLIDTTLNEKLQLLEDTAEILKKNIFQFKECLVQRKILVKHGEKISSISEISVDVISSNVVVDSTDSASTALNEDKQAIMVDLYEIDVPGIRLHEVSNFNEYLRTIVLALARQDTTDLLGLINYKQARLGAIIRLIDQLSLCLALDEPQEKICFLYHWIEILRGRSPGDRILFKGRIVEEALKKIHEDPILNEIYFKLPRILQADLLPEAEYKAEETRITNSARSIDDLKLDLDQILKQWSNFISQEKSKLELMKKISIFSDLILLMDDLSMAILESQTSDLEMIFRWKQQLKTAYKLYQITQYIPSEKRLLTQEPLTEKEYQLIQTHHSFSSIFRSLNREIQERVCQEQYKSILLSALASHSSSECSSINKQGFLKHDKELTEDTLLNQGEFEFIRGFRFLIEGKFLQYKIKYEAEGKLLTILMDEGFLKKEAYSIIGFMREQVVYSIFLYFLAARAKDVKNQNYLIKELPQYVNIYKKDSIVYFVVKSSPWSFVRTDDFTFFPAQLNSKQVEYFYDAEFTLCYELIIGEKIIDDILRLVSVSTNTQASWQLLNFENSEWKTLPVIKRHIKEIEEVILDLINPNIDIQKTAKIKIEQWLNDKPYSLHHQDYELIQRHIQSIMEVDSLSFFVGKFWLEKIFEFCVQKVKSQDFSRARVTESLLSESANLDTFDLQAVGIELLSGIPDRVVQAKRNIEYFLSTEKLSLSQCNELKKLLVSILTKIKVDKTIDVLNKKTDVVSTAIKVDVASTAKEKEDALYRDWLETYIKICNHYIGNSEEKKKEMPQTSSSSNLGSKRELSVSRFFSDIPDKLINNFNKPSKQKKQPYNSQQHT